MNTSIEGLSLPRPQDYHPEYSVGANNTINEASIDFVRLLEAYNISSVADAFGLSEKAGVMIGRCIIRMIALDYNHVKNDNNLSEETNKFAKDGIISAYKELRKTELSHMTNDQSDIQTNLLNDIAFCLYQGYEKNKTANIPEQETAALILTIINCKKLAEMYRNPIVGDSEQNF